MNSTNQKYTRFLLRLLFCRVLDSRSISYLFDNENAASYYRQKALDAGHIRKYTYSKRARVQHKENMFMLTQEGFHYLLENETSVLSNFNEYDFVCKLSVHSCGTKSSERRLKTAKDSAALVFAAMAGACIPFENFSTFISPEDTRIPIESTEDFVRHWLDKDMYSALQVFRTKDSQIEFHNQKIVKVSVSRANDFVSMHDYQSGRCSGVIESRSRAMNLYTAPMFGMSWSPWLTEREISALVLWKKMRSSLRPEAITPYDNQAGLIVTGLRQFVNLYRDVDHASRSSMEEFGGCYDHLYILPFSKEGAEHLHWLMDHMDAELNDQAKQHLFIYEKYKINEAGNRRIFPLCDPDGCPTALCFLLDAKQLLQIERQADYFPTWTFTVLCFPWQVPYCRGVLPENVRVVAAE